MRILWYGKWDNVDGNHMYMKTLSTMQADRGHEVIVTFCGNHGTNLEDRHPAVQYLPLPYLYKSQPWALSHPAAPARFRNILATYRPDLVHASLAVSNFDLFIPGICRQSGVPWVATFHISFADHWDRYVLFSYFNHLFYKKTLKKAAKVIIFSHTQRSYLRSMLKFPPELLEIIPNGVHADVYVPGPSRFRESIDADFVVGYFGRLAPEKNVGILCEAFRNIGDSGSYLVIMGKGMAERGLLRRYGSHPRIVFTGYRSNIHEKIDIIRGLDVFVLPSSIEGLSLSLLEAMSCAVAPVVTDVGGNAELAKGCGIIVNPRAIRKGTEEALTYLRRDSRRTKTMGEEARRKVRAGFTWNDNYARLARVYSETVRR